MCVYMLLISKQVLLHLHLQIVFVAASVMSHTLDDSFIVCVYGSFLFLY